MWRLVKLMLHGGLVMAAAVFGFAIVDGGPVPSVPFLPAASGVLAGAIGLLFGFVIAWARRQPWHLFPMQMRIWASM